MQKKRVLSVILALTLSIGCAIPAPGIFDFGDTEKG